MLIGLVVAGLLLLGLVYEQVSRHRDARKLSPGEMVDVGGYRLHLTDTGQGDPTVIILLQNPIGKGLPQQPKLKILYITGLSIPFLLLHIVSQITNVK